MSEHEASRTLVKSPPELWAELSDPQLLAGHLAEPFGEIRITRLEPETVVAWEGERARGTVRIESSGWGTRVTLTAIAQESEARAAVPVETEPAHQRRTGLRARVFGWIGAKADDDARDHATAASAPAPSDPAAPAPTASDPAAPASGPAARASAPAAPDPAAPPAARAPAPSAALARVLDDLGAAHRRPFSRT